LSHTVAVIPEHVSGLIAALSQLPGIGPRSAERIALYLVQAEPGVARRVADSVLEARAHVRLCELCGALTENSPCGICTDARRDGTLLCLVERPVDILSVEKSGTFRGKYHVLGGKISPLNGVGPEDLKIAELEARIAREPIKEVVVALSTDVEGDATSFYLAKRLAREGLLITRIAHGLPAGAGLEFADEITLSRALEGRREL
jgi:recombination protein RecR